MGAVRKWVRSARGARTGLGAGSRGAGWGCGEVGRNRKMGSFGNGAMVRVGLRGSRKAARRAGWVRPGRCVSVRFGELWGNLGKSAQGAEGNEERAGKLAHAAVSRAAIERGRTIGIADPLWTEGVIVTAERAGCQLEIWLILGLVDWIRFLTPFLSPISESHF
jgi:hypothetical protein